MFIFWYLFHNNSIYHSKMETPFIDLRLPNKDAWGRLKTVSDNSLFGGLFTFDIPSRKWLIYEDGSEIANSASTKATSVNHEGYFRSDGGTVKVKSRRHARYQPNRGYYYAGAGMVDNATADCILQFGVGTDENGYFFELTNGVLYAVRRALGTDYKEVINLPTGADLTKGFLFDIQSQMRLVGDAEFYITTIHGTTIHHMSNLAQYSSLALPNPQMPLFFYAENVTEDNGIKVGCVDVSTEGGNEPDEEYGSASFLDVSTGNGTVVAAIRQPELIGSYKNTRDVRLARITFNCEKKANFEIYVTRDATAITTSGGGADWTAVNSGSYVEKVNQANVTAFDTAKMELLTVGSVQAGETNFIDNPSRETIDFFLVHGDYIIIVGYAASGSSTLVIEFGEEV